VYPAPTISLGPDRDICTGQQLLLNPGSFASYSWNNGSINQTLTVNSTGVYTVLVKDNHGCTGADSITIKHINPLPAAFLKETDTICNYGKLEIIPSKTFSSYQWSDGSFQPKLTAVSAGSYSVIVTDSNGCKGADTIRLISKQCLSGFYVPNGFTPNGDKNNDTFKPLVYGPVLQYSFQIYNRFGQLIFSSTDPQKSWDGSFNGKTCTDGNYIWQCHYQFEGSKPAYEKGFVILLR